MDLVVAGDYADLCYHALAFLAVRDASSAHDARYVAWVERALPREAFAPLAEDAGVLAALYERDPVAARALHALPLLHTSVAHFLATAARPLASLAAGDVADGGVLASLRALDEALVEVLRADMALCARAYAAARRAVAADELARAREGVAEHLAAAERVAPDLARVRVELSHALGPRGRGLGARVVVGAPVAWSGEDPATSAAIALHEVCVQRAPPGASYEDAERAGLEAGARAARAAGGALRAAYERWIGRLDLAGLSR